jgi:Zn-dependent metalloprotease
MKKKHLGIKILGIIFTCFLINNSYGDTGTSNQSSTKALGSYKNVKILAGLEYELKYKKPLKGNPVDMAYEFFELNKSSFPVTNPRAELIPKYQTFDNISGVISFRQVYKGIPFQFSEITVRFTGSGELKSVEGEYRYDINLPTTPSIDSASAIKLALQAMGSPKSPKVIGPGKPIIVSSQRFRPPKEDRLYLVWIVEIFPESTKPYGHFERFYIDAFNGNVLYQEASSTFRH